MSGKEKKRTTTEPVVTISRRESRMEVDEAPRSSGLLNLDSVAQEHMIEGLEARGESNQTANGHCAARTDVQLD